VSTQRLWEIKLIFLDVGAHKGQTIERVLGYPEITHIYAFEPFVKLSQHLVMKYEDNSRVEICQYGLWNQTCQITLHNAGSQGASIWPDYNLCHAYGADVLCHMVRASDWIGKIFGDIILKLNCEGCEADIIDDLLDTGVYDKLFYLLIDWDVRKSPSQAHRRAEVEDRLRKEGKKNFSEFHGEDKYQTLDKLLA